MIMTLLFIAILVATTGFFVIWYRMFRPKG
jgi:hypothetical protein